MPTVPACTPPGTGLWRLSPTSKTGQLLAHENRAPVRKQLVLSALREEYEYVWTLGAACRSRRWAAAEARTCLKGRKLHLVGHSITRGLAFHIASLLRGEAEVPSWLPSRREQQRLCRTNSSSWIYSCRIDVDATSTAVVFDWGLPHAEVLDVVMRNASLGQAALPDLLLFADNNMRDLLNAMGAAYWDTARLAAPIAERSARLGGLA